MAGADAPHDRVCGPRTASSGSAGRWRQRRADRATDDEARPRPRRRRAGRCRVRARRSGSRRVPSRTSGRPHRLRGAGCRAHARRPAIRGRHAVGLPPPVRAQLRPLQVDHPARAGQSRVLHDVRAGLLRLLQWHRAGTRDRRRAQARFLQFRTRPVARRGDQQQLRSGGRLRSGQCAGTLAARRPRPTPGSVHAGVLAPRALQLGVARGRPATGRHLASAGGRPGRPHRDGPRS